MKHLIVIYVLLYFITASAGMGVRYFLYTQNNPDKPIELDETNSVIDWLYSPIRSIKILSHGMVDNSSMYWCLPTVKAYLAMGVWNIISVDWQQVAAEKYAEASLLSVNVGQDIARKIVDISHNSGIPLSGFHLIGHSLGAHMFGFTGKEIIKLTGQKVGRITGLDPAGPLFTAAPTGRLSQDDATYVDVMHTDSVSGFRTPIGHADFWPNAGRNQNGCGLNIFCSHTRAPIYFYESIGNHNFPAWKCSGYVEFLLGLCMTNQKTYMGEHTEPTDRGNFYLMTNAASPFGRTNY